MFTEVDAQLAAILKSCCTISSIWYVTSYSGHIVGLVDKSSIGSLDPHQPDDGLEEVGDRSVISRRYQQKLPIPR